MTTFATGPGPEDEAARSAIAKLFDDTRKRLVETGTRNRLVHVNRANARGNVLNIVNERSDDVHAILSSGKVMRFLAIGRDKEEDRGDIVLADAPDDQFDTDRYTDAQLETRLGPDGLQKKLLKIAREAQTAEEESGVNILYVAMGFLTWFEDKASSVPREAPLVLLPVELIRNARTSTYDLRLREEDVLTNLPLQARLMDDFGIQLPELEIGDEWKPGDYFASVEQVVAARDRWTIDPDAMQLGFFSFSKLLMYRDLAIDAWAVMTDGQCRITIIDGDGRPAVRDVKEGDLWYFPPGLPHSLQGIGTGGAEFTLVFDNGHASEFNTLLLTDWLAHTPPDILAENFGLPESAFKNIPTDNLWIYQAPTPPPSLADAQRAVRSPLGEPEFEFTFSMGSMKPTRVTRSGSVKVVDTRNFPVSKTISAALVTVKPGGLRELHWHPNADEWQYYLAGEARMTVFNTGPRAQTADFRAGDLGYVKKSFGHYVQNTGKTDLIFLEIFKSDRFAEVSLAQWLACTPPELVAQHTNMDPNLIAQFSKARFDIVPA